MNKVSSILSFVVSALCLGAALLRFFALYFLGGAFFTEMLQAGILYLMSAVLFYYFGKYLRAMSK